MRSSWSFFLLTVLACGAATTSNPEKPGPTQNVKATIAPGETMDLTRQTTIHAVEFAYPRRQVWDAILTAHGNDDLALVQADEKSGILVYQFNDRSRNVAGQPAANYVDCGMGPAGPRAATYRLNIKLTHRVEATSENMSRFSSEVHATATHAGMSSDVIECSTTMILEKRMVGLVAAQLK